MLEVWVVAREEVACISPNIVFPHKFFVVESPQGLHLYEVAITILYVPCHINDFEACSQECGTRNITQVENFK